MKCALPEKKGLYFFPHNGACSCPLSPLLYQLQATSNHRQMTLVIWNNMLPKTWVNGCNMVQLLKGLTNSSFFWCSRYQFSFGGIYSWVLLFCWLQIMSGSVNKLYFLQLLDFSTFTSSATSLTLSSGQSKFGKDNKVLSPLNVDWGEIAQRWINRFFTKICKRELSKILPKCPKTLDFLQTIKEVIRKPQLH